MHIKRGNDYSCCLFCVYKSYVIDCCLYKPSCAICHKQIVYHSLTAWAVIYIVILKFSMNYYLYCLHIIDTTFNLNRECERGNNIYQLLLFLISLVKFSFIVSINSWREIGFVINFRTRMVFFDMFHNICYIEWSFCIH